MSLFNEVEEAAKEVNCEYLKEFYRYVVNGDQLPCGRCDEVKIIATVDDLEDAESEGWGIVSPDTSLMATKVEMLCPDCNAIDYDSTCNGVVLDCDDDLSNGALYIYDTDGKEIVSWTEDEWKKDPTVVMSMCQCLITFFTQGDVGLKSNLNKD